MKIDCVIKEHSMVVASMLEVFVKDRGTVVLFIFASVLALTGHAQDEQQKSDHPCCPILLVHDEDEAGD